MRIRSADVPGPARETRHCFCCGVIGDHNSLDVVSNCGKKSSGKLDVVIDCAGLLLPTAATGHLAVTHLATALWESLERHEAATLLDTALWTSFGRGLLFVHCTVQIYRDPRCDKMKIEAAHKFELLISAQKSFGLDNISRLRPKFSKVHYLPGPLSPE